MTKQKRAAAEDMSPLQTDKRSHPEIPAGADWSRLPAPATYLIMKSLLPASHADVFSAARVCRAWMSVFRACRRDLLSSMPPLAVHSNLEAHPAVTDEWRWSPTGAARRRWERPVVLGASHGHLFVNDDGSDLPRRRIFLLEAVAALTGEETPVIPLPRIFLDPGNLVLLLTAHPASPRCVVVALVNQAILLCCRIGDRQWTGEYYGEDYSDEDEEDEEVVPSHIHKLFATISRSKVAVDGKIYAMTDEGKLLIVESFFPQLNVSVLDVGGFPPEDPFPCGFMLESGGDILCFLDDPDGDVDDTAEGAEAWTEGHVKFGAFRLDLPARRWVRADAALGEGSRAFLLNYHGQCLSWEAAGSGDEGRVYARGWGFDNEWVTVYHMKHGLVEQRKVAFANYFFLPGACYPSP